MESITLYAWMKTARIVRMNKVITGTPRKHPYCLICQEMYMDFCMEHHNIKGSWEMRE